MSCDNCCPRDYDDDDNRDYGFDLPDERATYEIRVKCKCRNDKAYAEAEEGCDLCEWTGYADDIWLTVRIHRVSIPCECEEGNDWKPVFHVYKNAIDEGVWFDTQSKAETWIGIQYPEASLPEPDPDWESERHLRRAEGWGY
jgi:hypothetical protein